MRVLVCVSTYVIHSQLNSPRAVTKEAGSRGCKHQQHGQMVHSADGKEEPTKGNGSVYTRHTLRFNVIRQLKDSERNDRWQFSLSQKKKNLHKSMICFTLKYVMSGLCLYMEAG